MTVNVVKFPQPKFYLSLVSGGSLDTSTTYYFIGFFQRGGGYYGNAVSPCSEELSIQPTSGNQSIKAEWWQDGGDISSFADAGGGDVTVTTSAAHGRSNGDSVWIRGTTNYDGEYTISNASGSTFDITVTWNGDDGASKWFADQGLPTYAAGIIFKWDKFTMIDSGDSEPYQWLNLNDTANSGSAEFDGSYGHRRWTIRYYLDGHTGNDNTWTKEATSYNGNKDELHDGIVESTSRYASRGMVQPQISFRNDSNNYDFPEGFAKDQGKLLVYFDDNSDNDENDMIDALEASGYNDMFKISHLNNGKSDAKFGFNIILLGCVFIESTSTTTLNDLNLTCIGNSGIFRDSSSNATYNRCNFTFIKASDSFWIGGRGSPIDSTISVLGSTHILDDYQNPSNFTPMGKCTFYNSSYSGYNMIGGFVGAPPYFQWRYPNNTSEATLSNFYIKDFYIYLTYTNTGGGDDNDTHLDTVDFENDGKHSYDILVTYSYCDGNDIDFTHECKNITSDRTGGKIIISMSTNSGDPNSISDVWNFKYGISLTVIDVNDNPIEGASCVLTDSNGTSHTQSTDSNGECEVIGKGYSIEYDSGDADGNGYETKTSDWNTFTLEIKAPGYETYKYENFDLKEGKVWRIPLKRARQVRNVDGKPVFAIQAERGGESQMISV